MTSSSWTQGPTLGRGATATVSLALFQSGRILAAKSAPVCQSSPLIHEEDVLSKLPKCPHIISCYGRDVVGGSHHLLLEYLSGGSLRHVVTSRGPLRLPKIKRYTISLLQALSVVHERNYVHCDVKLSNILIGDDDDVIKIADFGSATRTSPNATLITRGTPMYMSPEVITRKEYTPAADIWAFGCAVIEMATGNPPWRTPPGENGYGLMMRVGFGEEEVEIPEKAFPEKGKDFLRKCLARDPTKRWTAEMLLNHPFLTDTDTDMNTECVMSPKSILHFPMNESIESVEELESSTSYAAKRIKALATGQKPDWKKDDWISIRGEDSCTRLAGGWSELN